MKGQLEGKGTRVKELEHCVQGYERRLKTEEQKTTDAQVNVCVGMHACAHICVCVCVHVSADVCACPCVDRVYMVSCVY